MGALSLLLTRSSEAQAGSLSIALTLDPVTSLEGVRQLDVGPPAAYPPEAGDSDWSEPVPDGGCHPNRQLQPPGGQACLELAGLPDASTPAFPCAIRGVRRKVDSSMRVTSMLAMAAVGAWPARFLIGNAVSTVVIVCTLGIAAAAGSLQNAVFAAHDLRGDEVVTDPPATREVVCVHREWGE